MGNPNGTILLVEDNDTLRGIYSDILGFGGYGVLAAGDGQRGLEMAKANKPDFILLDLEMPKLNGFEVLERLRADEATQAIPVVVFSAVNDQAEIRKAIGLGANGYLKKGVHAPKYVLDTVKSFMPNGAGESTKASEPLPPPPAHKLQVTEYQPAAEGLWTQTISIKDYRCPGCGEEVVLEMYPGPEQDGGHWFYGRFVCVKCLRFF